MEGGTERETEREREGERDFLCASQGADPGAAAAKLRDPSTVRAPGEPAAGRRGAAAARVSRWCTLRARRSGGGGALRSSAGASAVTGGPRPKERPNSALPLRVGGEPAPHREPRSATGRIRVGCHPRGAGGGAPLPSPEAACGAQIEGCALDPGRAAASPRHGLAGSRMLLLHFSPWRTRRRGPTLPLRLDGGMEVSWNWDGEKGRCRGAHSGVGSQLGWVPVTGWRGTACNCSDAGVATVACKQHAQIHCAKPPHSG